MTERPMTDDPKERLFAPREVAKMLGVFDGEFEALIRRDLIPGIIHDEKRRRWISEASIVALLEQKERLDALLEPYRRRVRADLEREIVSLREQLEQARQEATDARTARSEEIIAAMPLDDLLEVVSRQPEFRGDWSRDEKRYRVRATVQSHLDEFDLKGLDTTKRPKYTNKAARRQLVATAIGPVDVWLWPGSRGTWRGAVGGPRPRTHLVAESRPALVKMLTGGARVEYGKPVRTVSARLRYQVLKRDGFACHYCGRRPPEIELHVDHVQPIAAGGGSDQDNLVAACLDCNLGKGAS